MILFEKAPESELSRGLGWALEVSPGYKNVFIIFLWNHTFVWEFGKGDSYDW